MRVLWVSFLLIGSITCFPPPQGGLSSSVIGSLPWSYLGPSSGQNPKPTLEKPSGQASGPSSSISYPGSYYSSSSTAGGAGSSGSGPQLYSGQDGQSGAPGSQQVTQESWTSPDGEEPVFTPVDDEDQAYAFKSRSRYNKNRFLFSLFRYFPTEPLHPQEPVFPHPGKTSQHSKGGF